MKGKNRALEVLRSYGDQDSLSTFTVPRSTPEDIANGGERFLLKLYGAVRSTSLDKLYYILYTRSVSRSSLSSGFKLESLPPTAAATKFHSYRVDLVVQQLIGNKLFPTDCMGLAIHGLGFSPTHYRSASSACTCVANRVERLQEELSEDMRMPEGRVVDCSPMCSYCNGQTCNNIHALAVSQDDS